MMREALKARKSAGDMSIRNAGERRTMQVKTAVLLTPCDKSADEDSEAVDDTRFIGVVGGHFDFHAVTDNEANEAFAHFA